MMKLYLVLVCLIFPYKVIANEACLPRPELSFFHKLAGELEIELSEPASQIGKLANKKASSKATIKSVSLVAEVFEEDTGFRDIIEDELSQIAFKDSSIVLSGLGQEPLEHKSSNGEFFTVRDLLKAIEITEQKTRGKTDWFGGINVHHVWLEGIGCQDGVWSIYWGS